MTAHKPRAEDLHTPSSAEPASSEEKGFWSAYWERFRRQEVDDPVEDRREGVWDRFRRQQVDDPVRGSRG